MTVGDVMFYGAFPCVVLSRPYRGRVFVKQKNCLLPDFCRVETLVESISTFSGFVRVDFDKNL